jgi:hypothetical protein
MASIIAETLDGGAVYFIRHCSKCGGELDANQQCTDCMYSEDTFLTPDEGREFTSAGD